MSNIWDSQYKAGQGRYFPAEELVRFLGRTYGPVTQKKATGLTAIEIGSGVGGNIMALTQWGFFVYALELSTEAIRLAADYAEKQGFTHYKDLRQYKAPAPIHLPSKSANLVIDIQTLQHLNKGDHEAMYYQIHRVLATNGKFFSVHWCGDEAAGRNIFPAHPELGQWHEGIDLICLIKDAGFNVTYCETVAKTYGVWAAKWVVIEAVKI